VLLLALAVSACSDDAPTAPETNPLPLDPGTYVLSVSGDPFACNDVFVPQTGTVARALATATLSGNDWILRATTPVGGEFELRLREGGTAQTPAALPVTGTIRGQVIDSFSVTFPPTGVRASFQTVQVNGEMPPAGRTIDGRFNGQVIFSRDNLVSFCPPGAVAFRVSPLTE
jgi:hypothetical protein